MQNNVRSQITAAQLTSSLNINDQVENQWFTPHRLAAKAQHDLLLSINVAETIMNCNHIGVEVNNGRIDYFPAVKFRLASVDNVLVPLDRGLLRDPDGQSYWDISLSPGRVWSEPDDGNWSRAALPFQLSNIFENDTHHGVATFLYNHEETTSIYYQITAETKAFLAPAGLQAWGYLTARTEPLESSLAADALQSIQVEISDQHPLNPLQHLYSEEIKAHFEDMGQGFGSDSTLLYGLFINDEIFATPCRTSAGDYPYPRAMKFGIWSATKTAFATVACLRLAKSFGVDPRMALVRDLMPEAENIPAWQNITIGDCLNMATGIGTAAVKAEPLGIFGDYLLEIEHTKGIDRGFESYHHYHDWFLAPSQHEKNVAAFACPSYSWGPGDVARYRDQDLYIAGAAMDAWLKLQHGPDARIWDMVRDEVYSPARIHHAIKFHTIETDLQHEVPLSDAGLLLTMDNIAPLGRLFHNHGRIGDEQILDPGILDEIFNPRKRKGLPTGTHTTDGEIYYHGGTWHLPYIANSNETFWIPVMCGYGGQLIYILPNGVTAFRFAFDSHETEERYDMLKIVRLADAIQPF
jgi:hypothetical protein